MHNLKYKYCVCLVFLCFWSINNHEVVAQNQVRKVGLCLSGGGAKGLAHIGLLKIIDSLGIQIDYITGTSMGSVVGGLYASGYSGKQIESIARTIEWEKILSRYVSMNEIFIDEKDEYMRYVAEFPIDKGKLNFTGLIDGQELLNLFSKLTQHTAHIKNFDNLPIPYHCMAVDIITVQPVEIKSGNLALAMRASMSIPTIFRPVKIGDYLLVDGGLLENFPVSQLKDMGADFIIGSYTGGKLLKEDELTSVDKILVQSSLYYGIQRASILENECDIMNNLTKGMGTLSSGSFNKAIEILDSGSSISKHCLPSLIELAEIQKKEGRLRTRINGINSLSDTVLVNSITIDDKLNGYIKKFADKRILNNGKFKPVAVQSLDKLVSRLYGSRNFSAVSYELFSSNEGLKAVFHAPQDFKVKVKPAIHFDTERGVGVILNATFRNVLGPNSRFLISADIAQAPKIRLHYRKYLNNSNWSINALVFGEKAEQKIYEDKTGKTSDIYSNSLLYSQLGISVAVDKSTLLSFAMDGEYGKLKPKLETNQSVESKIKQGGIVGVFTHNTFNQPYYTKKGLDITLSGKLPIWAFQDVSLTQTKEDSLGNEVKVTNSASLTNQPYLKNSIRINYFAKASEKFTVNCAIYEGLIFNNIFSKQVQTISNNRFLTGSAPINDFFFLGGTDQRSRPYLVGLAGLKEGELVSENFNIFKLGFQYEPFKKFFISGYSQYYTTASSPQALYRNLFKWNTDFNMRKDSQGGEYASLISFCGSLGYQSPIGPINLFVSKASSFSAWRIYFSIGFKF